MSLQDELDHLQRLSHRCHRVWKVSLELHQLERDLQYLLSKNVIQQQEADTIWQEQVAFKRKDLL